MSANPTLFMKPALPDADAEIRAAGQRIVGTALGLNPLAHAPEVVAQAVRAAPGNLVLLWSGWMGHDREQRDVRNWGPDAWARLEALVDHLESAPDLGDKRILLRPVVRGVLSDLQRCRKLFFERPRRRIALALEPCAFLESGMLATVEDHLDRAIESLGSLAGAIVLGNVGRGDQEDADEAPLKSASVQSGLVPPALLGKLGRRRPDPGVPVILITDNDEAALRALAWDRTAT